MGFKLAQWLFYCCKPRMGNKGLKGRKPFEKNNGITQYFFIYWKMVSGLSVCHLLHTILLLFCYLLQMPKNLWNDGDEWKFSGMQCHWVQKEQMWSSPVKYVSCFIVCSRSCVFIQHPSSHTREKWWDVRLPGRLLEKHCYFNPSQQQ